MKHTIIIILMLIGFSLNAQTFEYYKKKIAQYSKHRVVFDDKEFQEILEKSDLINFENCIGNITNEQMSSKMDSLHKASHYNFKKKPSKVDLYNYKVLEWRNYEKCIKYKLANNIPFKEYEEPEDLFPEEQRKRIENHNIVFENKKLEKYAFAYHNLQIRVFKNPFDSTDYSKDFKRLHKKLERFNNMSVNDSNSFNVLMSKTSLICNNYMNEQAKKFQEIKKQIRQMYAEK